MAWRCGYPDILGCYPAWNQERLEKENKGVMMTIYNATVEDNNGNVWEGVVIRDCLEINDYVSVRLHTKKPQYAVGYVINFEEPDDAD